MSCFLSPDDARIRTNEDQARKRVVYLLNHKVTLVVTVVFFSAFVIVSFCSEYEHYECYFVRPLFSTLT